MVPTYFGQTIIAFLVKNYEDYKSQYKYTFV